MATLTCHTEGCANADIPIEYDMTYRDEEGRVHQLAEATCTACREDIIDIQR